MPPTNPEHADDPPEVRRLRERVEALDLGAVISAPTGDLAFAAACLERWGQIVRGLVDADGTVLRVLRAVDPEAVGFVEFLDARDPPPALPDAWTLEWAECPLDVLVDPEVLDHEESLEAYSYYCGGLTWCGAPAISRLCEAVLRKDGGDPHVPMPLRAEVPAGFRRPRYRFVFDMLIQVARGVVNHALTFALLHPRFGDNPFEVELMLLEHGLFPLGVDDRGGCQVLRPSPGPVVLPAWLPHFTDVL